MARELTVKERKLIKGIAEGKTKKQAAIDAKYSPRSAGSIASETLRKPDVRAALVEAMEKAGITDTRIVEVMNEGLRANRVISARVIHSRPSSIEDGEQEADERTDDFVEVPDHATRHKFLETVIDVKGAKAAKKLEVRDQTLEDLIANEDAGGDDSSEA